MQRSIGLATLHCRMVCFASRAQHTLKMSPTCTRVWNPCSKPDLGRKLWSCVVQASARLRWKILYVNFLSNQYVQGVTTFVVAPRWCWITAHLGVHYAVDTTAVGHLQIIGTLWCWFISLLYLCSWKQDGPDQRHIWLYADYFLEQNQSGTRFT